MKTKTLYFLSLILCTIFQMPLLANDELILNDVISNFKRASTSGYSIKYYGVDKMKREGKFEGNVILNWSTEGEIILEAANISGVYHINDILGKRDEEVEITLIKKEFWKVLKNQKQYLYSPNIEATLWTNFNRSPLIVNKALAFLKKNEEHITITETQDNDKLLMKLYCKSEGESFSVLVNKGDKMIHKVIWEKDKWGGGEIVGEVSVEPNSENKSTVDVPILENYKKTEIPTKGYIAPNWNSEFYSGGTVSLSQFKGNVVLMDFWATWCPPCIRAIPALEKVSQKYKAQGLTVIGMNYLEKKNPLKTLSKLKASYKTVKAEKIGKDYGILNWPTLFVIDKKGVIRDILIGYKGEETEKEVEKWVSELLAE